MVLSVNHQSVPNSKLGLGLGLGLDNILGSHWRWSYQSTTVVFLECKIVEKGVYRDVFRGCIVVSKREFCEGVLGINPE